MEDLLSDWDVSGNSHRYYHRGGKPVDGSNVGPPIDLAESLYDLEIEVTDDFKKKAAFTRILQILNTTEGNVVNHEIWSDMGGTSTSHLISGDITILSDIKVEVRDNSTIDVVSMAL